MTKLCDIALIVLVILNTSKTDGHFSDEHVSLLASSGNNEMLESISGAGGKGKEQLHFDDAQKVEQVQECDKGDEGYEKEDEGNDKEDEGNDKEDEGNDKEDEGNDKEDEGNDKEDEGNDKEDEGNDKEDEANDKEDEANNKGDEGYDQFRLEEFLVAGVNLASYDPGQPIEPYSGDEEPFELFEDFDIGHLVNGDEDWWQFREKKGDSVGYLPTLAFYNDKIARKRLEQSQGIPIPRLFALKYLSELISSKEAQIDQLTQAILKLLPKQGDFCAKPNHGTRSRGVWLVSRDTKTGQTWVSEGGWDLEPQTNFSLTTVARSLAEELIKPVPDFASRGFHVVEPGVVIEERFTTFDDVDGILPPLEFKVFTFWGRVFVANWVRGQKPYFTESGGPGQVHRNGTMVKGSQESSLPGWLDWSRVVNLAEASGANKDFFRVDVLVGLPAGSPVLQNITTEDDQRAAAQYVVSEGQYTGSEYIPNSKILEEGLRLWVAGYKIGNYGIVPNREVPSDFKVKQQENDKEDKETYE